MAKKILLVIGLVVLLFLGYVASRPSAFRYERSGLINARAEKIYPYLNNFQRGGEWSPYERIDPAMTKNYSGPESGPGAAMHFSGNKEVGEGQLEILKAVPNSSVDIRLEMTRPFHAENLVEYRLSPEGTGTRFVWAMSGNSNFFFKLIGVFIDCEKMVGDQMDAGIKNLKAVVEAK